MPSPRLTRALAAGAMCWLAGCSLFTDLGGLTSGSEGGSSVSPDATSSTDGGGLPTGDATTSGDAPKGDATGGDAEGGGSIDMLSCAAGSHLFCTTFDSVKLLGVFDAVNPGSGAISIENSASFSSPSALRIVHPGGSPAATPSAQKTLSTNGLAGLKCRMRYRREAAGGGILVLFILDVKTNGNARLFAEIKDGPSNGKLYIEVIKPDGATASDFPDIPTFGPAVGGGAWSLVEWTLDFKAGTSTIARDGAKVDTRAFAAPFDGSLARSIGLTIGLGGFEPPASPWTVQVDDLVCDAL